MIGKNVARFRKELGMTQDEPAEKLLVSRQTVSSWERGRTQPDLETVKGLAEAFHRLGCFSRTFELDLCHLLCDSVLKRCCVQK